MGHLFLFLFGILLCGMIRESESVAMKEKDYENFLIFYNSLSGDQWVYRPPLDINSVCGWAKNDRTVRCNTDGNITHIILVNNDLRGTIPTEIALLESLEQIIININRITGTIISEFGLMPKLKRIKMDENRLTGTIPTELGLSKTINRISIDQCDLFGTLPTEIGKLSAITEIDFDSNRLTGTIPTEYFLLTKLFELDLDTNQLTGTIPSISLASEMQEFSIYSNLISGTIPSHLGICTKAYMMYMANNSFTGTIPSELANVVGLKELTMNNNKLVGTVPSELAKLDLIQLQLRTNNLDCPATDYSTWSVNTDYLTTSFECSILCKEEVYMGAHWPSTPQYNNTGICIDGYQGSPSRICSRSGNMKEWSDEVIDPCQTVPLSNRIAGNWRWIVVVGVLIGLCGILTIVHLFFLVKKVHKNYIFLFAIPLSWCTLISQAFFTYSLFLMKETGLFWSSIAFLSFSVVVNFFSSLLISGLIIIFPTEWSRKYALLLALLLPLSIPNTYNMNIINSNMFGLPILSAHIKDFQKVLNSISICSYIFRDLPFLIIGILSLSQLDLVPFVSFIMLLLTSCSLFFGVTREVTRWSHHFMKTHQDRKESSSLKKEVEMSQKEEDDENGNHLASYVADLVGNKEDNVINEKSQKSKMSTDTEVDSVSDKGIAKDQVFMEEPKDIQTSLFKVLLYITIVPITPVILLILSLEFFTLISIPYTLFSIRKYMLVWTADPSFREFHENKSKYETNWYIKRGFFILPFRFLTWVVVGCLFFPIVCLTGVFTYPLSKISRSMKKYHTDLIIYYYFVLRCLLWSLFPFTNPPTYGTATIHFETRNNKWLISFGVLFFILFELLLPLVDIATDYVFSSQLYVQYTDTMIGNRSELFIWMVVSFLSASLGVVVVTLTYIYYLSVLQRKREKTLLELMLVGSGLFDYKPYISIARLFKFAGSTLEDFIQIIVSSNTVSFIERIGTFWALNISISIFNVVYTFSKLVSLEVFAKGYSIWVRSIVQLWFFVFFGTAICLIVSFSIRNNYCGTTRSIDSIQELEHIAECQNIGFDYLIQQRDFDEASIEAQESQLILIDSNLLLKSFFAPNLLQADQIVISNNPEMTVFDLPKLISPGKSLEISNNNKISQLSLPNLQKTQSSDIVITNNTALSDIFLPNLEVMEGDIIAENNNLLYQISITTFRLLSPTGQISIKNNPSLSRLFVPSLVRSEGPITLINNGMVTLELPWINTMKANFVLESNPNLGLVVLGGLLTLEGSIEIRNNPKVDAIRFGRLVDVQGQIVIENNPLLRLLDLSSLPSLSVVVIRNNTLLTTVQYVGGVFNPQA